MQERAGNFSDSENLLTGTVAAAYQANQLTSKLGYNVNVGEPFYTPGCGSSSQCVFPERLFRNRFGPRSRRIC